MNQTYQIEYFNDVWKDWLRVGPWAYLHKEQAEKAFEYYKTNHPDIEYRLAEYEKPKRVRATNLGRKVTTEKA
jgi:hypothetical protein